MRHLRVGVPDGLRNVLGRLADDLEVADHGGLDQSTLQERIFPICSELVDLDGRVPHVAQVGLDLLLGTHAASRSRGTASFRVDGGELALVMDHVAGQPLTDAIGAAVGPIPWERAWPLFERLLDAVGYAHDQGVVHRDLKPDNILLGPDGNPRIIDFGIAKDLDASGTRTGTGMGTVEYMAPEQYTDAKAVDARADVYSLGMILYEMLAGRLPWDPAATQFQILEQKARKQLMSPSSFCPGIPRDVVAALSPALSASPDGRPSATWEFAHTLLTAAASDRGTRGPSARRTFGPPEPRGPVAKNSAVRAARSPTEIATEQLITPDYDLDDPAIRDQVEDLARAMAHVATVPCPFCDDLVSPFGLLRHFDLVHAGESEPR